MANPVCEVLLTQERLEAPTAHVDLAMGAIVDFSGVVRESEDGRQIDGIEYEAHGAMAEHQLKKIAQQALADFDVGGVVIHHRIGFVRAGETSLLLRVAAQHRGEAFAASQWIVDELKRTVPIWKHPQFKIDNRPGKKAGVDGKIASIPSRS